METKFHFPGNPPLSGGPLGPGGKGTMDDLPGTEGSSGSDGSASMSEDVPSTNTTGIAEFPTRQVVVAKREPADEKGKKKKKRFKDDYKKLEFRVIPNLNGIKTESLNENDELRQSKMRAMDLKHIGYGHYKDKNNDLFNWDDSKNDFVKIEKEKEFESLSKAYTDKQFERLRSGESQQSLREEAWKKAIDKVEKISKDPRWDKLPNAFQYDRVKKLFDDLLFDDRDIGPRIKAKQAIRFSELITAMQKAKHPVVFKSVRREDIVDE